MREKLLTFGKDFEIKEASHRRGGRTGETKFYVDNKVLRLRETFNIRKSKHGEVLYQVQERKMRVRDTMKIEDRRVVRRLPRLRSAWLELFVITM